MLAVESRLSHVEELVERLCASSIFVPDRTRVTAKLAFSGVIGNDYEGEIRAMQ